ncbi:MAG: response regulator transcription factor [Fibrobacter sp.]|nr:response regulator transcription factor [Fibrobacter sp.]
MAHENILVVEDDEDIQILIRHNLVKDGFNVTAVASGEDALKKLRTEMFDCILLDIMLPGIDGLEVCKMAKKNPKIQNIPIIMLTAKGEETDIVAGLELGAEDYIVKPFSPRVLIARMRTVLRRKNRGNHDSTEVISINNLEIDTGRHSVTFNGVRLDLTHMEFQVLHLLAGQPGYVFTRNMVIESVRDDNYPVTDRSVDVVIVGLRRKLGDAGSMIETVRGVGYKFTEQE